MEHKKSSDEKVKNYSTLLFIIAFIVLGTACSVLYYILIDRIPISFIKEHEAIFFWIGEFLLTALFVASVVFAVRKMSKMSKLSITVYVLLVLVDSYGHSRQYEFLYGGKERRRFKELYRTGG